MYYYIRFSLINVAIYGSVLLILPHIHSLNPDNVVTSCSAIYLFDARTWAHLLAHNTRKLNQNKAAPVLLNREVFLQCQGFLRMCWLIARVMVTRSSYVVRNNWLRRLPPKVFHIEVERSELVPFVARLTIVKARRGSLLQQDALTKTTEGIRALERLEMLGQAVIWWYL